MTLLLAVLCVGSLAAVLIPHFRLAAAVRRPPAPVATLQVYPSVSVIRPVRGLDAGARENIAAALDTGYPGDIETIYVFDDESEPELPLVREAIRAHQEWRRHGQVRVVIAGLPPAFRTGKMHAMIAGLREARGELIVFGDSDTRPDRFAIRRLIEKLLGTPNAGASFAPVVVGPSCRTAGDYAAALMLNGLYGPDVSRVERRRGHMPFIMGQTMAFKRETLTRIGGLENIRGELVDDMHIGMRVVEAGMLNVVSPQPLEIVIEGLTMEQFARMYRRWLIFSRTGLPGWEFKWSSWSRGVGFFVPLLASLAYLAEGQLGPALLMTLPVFAFGWSTITLHEQIGGGVVPLKFVWLPFAIALAAPGAILSAILHPQVNWRGRTYKLDTASRLESDELRPAAVRVARRV
jgi:ceramide glucosyltransferase